MKKFILSSLIFVSFLIVSCATCENGECADTHIEISATIPLENGSLDLTIDEKGEVHGSLDLEITTGE